MSEIRRPIVDDAFASTIVITGGRRQCATCRAVPLHSLTVVFCVFLTLCHSTKRGTRPGELNHSTLAFEKKNYRVDVATTR